MKKLFILIAILISCNIYAQDRFSNEEYNFAITFPKGWDIKTKKGVYIVEASEDEYTSVSITAVKYPRLPDSMNIGYISRDSLKKIIEVHMINKFGKAMVLYSGDGLMDGTPAYYYFIQYSDKKDDYPTKFLSFQYQFLYKNIFYSIFAICLADRYEDYEKTFNSIYSTFRFIKKL